MSDGLISVNKRQQLQLRMANLGLNNSDLIEKFIVGSGKGGQKVNKTASCVYLKHLPSGVEVKCQEGRSQEMNRFFARRLLCDAIEERVLGEKSKKRQASEKIKRQKRKRSKRAKEKILKEKHKKSQIKSNRKGVTSENE
jgi:peptide chain release factor